MYRVIIFIIINILLSKLDSNNTQLNLTEVFVSRFVFLSSRERIVKYTLKIGRAIFN